MGHGLKLGFIDPFGFWHTTVMHGAHSRTARELVFSEMLGRPEGFRDVCEFEAKMSDLRYQDYTLSDVRDWAADRGLDETGTLALFEYRAHTRLLENGWMSIHTDAWYAHKAHWSPASIAESVRDCFSRDALPDYRIVKMEIMGIYSWGKSFEPKWEQVWEGAWSFDDEEGYQDMPRVTPAAVKQIELSLMPACYGGREGD